MQHLLVHSVFRNSSGMMCVCFIHAPPALNQREQETTCDLSLGNAVQCHVSQCSLNIHSISYACSYVVHLHMSSRKSSSYIGRRWPAYDIHCFVFSLNFGFKSLIFATRKYNALTFICCLLSYLRSMLPTWFKWPVSAADVVSHFLGIRIFLFIIIIWCNVDYFSIAMKYVYLKPCQMEFRWIKLVWTAFTKRRSKKTPNVPRICHKMIVFNWKKFL